MSDQDNHRQAAERRLLAEQRALEQHIDLSAVDVTHLIHELRVHQIELEMQNEELLKARQTLESSRQRYSDLYNHAPVGFFSLDEDGVILELNVTGARMLGKDYHELLHLPMSRLVFPEDQDTFYLFHRGLFAGSQAQDCEIRLLKAIGIGAASSPFPVLLHGALHAEGGSRWVILSASDITARKQAQEQLLHYQNHLEEMVAQRTAELEKANAQLHDLLSARDTFISNVSHELRTPLANLSLRQEMLRRHPERLERFLPVMERETRRLHQMIGGMLQLSRIDQHQSSITLASLDLTALIRQLMQDRAELAQQKNLTLTLAKSPEPLQVTADSGLIEQVAGILINNAINYTPSGGSISLWTFCRKVQGAPWAGFVVQDNGPGISPEEQQEIFQRFHRGKAARNMALVPGTGLGLALAKEIVEQHQGRIEIKSSGVEGEGAQFTVWLPVQTVSQKG